MNDEKHLIIHFIDGTNLSIAFPTQIKNSTGALVEAAKTILSSDKLVIQTDDRLLILPWSSVKYIESTAMPAAVLPFGTIKGARIVNEAGAVAGTPQV